MKNEGFNAISAIGIATITTTNGREPVSIAFAGARYDTLHVRPSTPMNEAQIAEAVAQGCNPALISASPPIDASMRYIAEFIGDSIVLTSEIYEDMDILWKLAEDHGVRIVWSTLRPEPGASGDLLSAAAAAASMYDQARAIYAVRPTYDNRLPHRVDLLTNADGKCNGFSIAGPVLKKRFVGFLPETPTSFADVEPANAKQLRLAFAADQLMMAGTQPRIRLEYASDQVRQRIEQALGDTLPEADKTNASLIAPWELAHSLNPANPDNYVALYDAASYPAS